MRPTLAFLALALGPAGPALAEAPPAPLQDTVRDAVAARKVEDAGDLSRANFRDVAVDGAVLVGLEAGLAKWFDTEIPYAIRPVFRRGTHEWTGAAAGSFSSKEVRRTVRVTAKPGYAVGGLWVRAGGALDRICLQFYRVTDGGFDPADKYTSPWIGSSDGGSDQYIDGRGQPIVGLAADAGRDQVRRLGVVLAKVPPRKPEPKAGQPAAKADAEPAALKPLDQIPLEPEEDDNGLMLVVLALSAAIGIPVGIIGLMSMGKKAPPPPDEEEVRRPRPRPRKPAERPAEKTTKPVTDRPELARRLSGYLPATVPTAAGGESNEPPPYFLVRASSRARRGRMTRIYVLPNELLVIDAGPGADHNEVAGTVAAVAAGGGMVGALIGGAVSTFVADAGKAKGEAIQRRLDRLDLAALLDLASGDGNVRARVEDLTGVCIDPPTFSRWREQSRAVGTFRFHDVKRGEFTFEFLNGAEVRGAVELLRRLLGSALRVGTDWDDATAVYLQGV